MPKFIKDWKDLVGLESEHYKLEIDVDMGCGWVLPKVENKETEDDYYEHHMYLSTHTFYGSHYKWSTEKLQSFGFDVELNNWDKED
jgi:hypothetical protein